jgi:predicted small lipoprotein YifL
MTKHLSVLFLSATLAACGSKPPPPTTPVEPPQDHADHDHGAGAGSSVAASDPTPKEPEAPAKPDAAKVKADLLAVERTAWDTAKPAFDKACATCHTKAGKKSAKKKMDHFNMDLYPPGGHHTGTIGFTIREVLGIDGKKPTMPFNKPGSVQGEDLEKIKAWTDAWVAADKGGAHPPPTAREEME